MAADRCERFGSAPLPVDSDSSCHEKEPSPGHDTTLRDIEMFKQGFEAADAFHREQAEKRRQEAVSRRSVIQRFFQPRRSQRQNQETTHLRREYRGSRRQLLKDVSALGLSATVATVATVVTDEFGLLPDTSINPRGNRPVTEQEGAVDHRGRSHALPNPVKPVIHDNWDFILDQDANTAFSEQFPDSTLSYDILTEDGDSETAVILENGESTVADTVRSIDDNGKDIWEITYYPDEPEEEVTLRFRETRPGVGIVDEQDVTCVIESFASTPEDPDDHPRVFSEIDVDTLYPEENILPRAHAIARRFDSVFPDMKISLFDAGNSRILFSRLDDLYDPQEQRIMFPLQYFTHPHYPHQGDIALYHTFSQILSEQNGKDKSRFQIASGELETFMKYEYENQLELFREMSRNGSLPLLMHAETSDLFSALRPDRYNPHIFEKSDAIFYLYTSPVPRYKKLLADALTVFGNYSTDFIQQFSITDRLHPRFLPFDEQVRIITATRHIFETLEAVEMNTDHLRKIIPDYDTVKSFITTFEPSSENMQLALTTNAHSGIIFQS